MLARSTHTMEAFPRPSQSMAAGGILLGRTGRCRPPRRFAPLWDDRGRAPGAIQMSQNVPSHNVPS